MFKAICLVFELVIYVLSLKYGVLSQRKIGLTKKKKLNNGSSKFKEACKIFNCSYNTLKRRIKKKIYPKPIRNNMRLGFNKED